MTKGKYATRAALRREDEGVRSDIETYQHHVQRLTRENEQLKAKLASAQKLHRDEARRLRAERDEGLSPEVAALRTQLREQRERAQAAAQRSSDVLKQWRRAFDGMVAWFHSAYGCTGLEAFEVVLALVGHHPDFTITAFVDSGVDPDEVERIEQLQTLRGYRGKSPKIALGERPAPMRSGRERKLERWTDPK